MELNMELTIDQALQKGVGAHKAGQVQEADRIYTAILKAQPKHPDANHNMGVLAVGVGKVQEALPFLKVALETNPSTAQFWLSYIDALIKLEKLTDAKAMLDQAKSKGAEGEGFNKLEKRLNVPTKIPTEPIVVSQEIESDQPNILDTLKLDQAIGLAKKMAKEGSLAEAKSIYQDVLVKFPKNKRACGGIKALSGGAIGKVAKVQEPPQDQVQLLINLYSQGQLLQALKQVEVLLQQFPSSSFLYNICGAVYKGLGQLDASIEAYTKALAIKADYAVVYSNMGNALQEKGKLEEAIEAYNKALALEPNFADTWNDLGITLHEKDKLEEAIEAYSQALAIKPDYAESWNNMGNSLKSQGKLDEAIEAYKKAIDIKPDYADAWNNMGITLHEQGELEKALETYNKALAIKPNHAEVYFNMGNALQMSGKLEQAIEAYTKAITIRPEYADAYNNMGNALKEQGKREEAIKAYKKAIDVNPDHVASYYNMGAALQEQGKLEEAIEAFKNALSIKPNFADVYNNMGHALKEQGKQEEAIEAFKNALSIEPDYAEAWYNMGVVLKGVVFNKPNSDLQKAIATILDHKTYVRPTDISSAAISLLKFEPVLQKVLQRQSKGQLIPFLNETVLNLSELPLLLKLMSVCPLADLVLESVLTDIRSGLLSSTSELEASSEVLQFQSALALQCFTNEYVYTAHDIENKVLEALETKVSDALLDGKQPSPQSILCLASYKALHEYDWCNLLSVTSDIEEVFTRQVIEPQKEGYLKSNIPALEEITDKVSFKVREQYEGSPYPRWVNLRLPLKPAAISGVINEVKLRLFDNTINEVEAPNILIAGCGTGQHSIVTAAQFKDSSVLAIDLSLSSLAYAKRKTEELGVHNIEYMQADILDLGKLERQFDIVESAGVLHHMADPMAGWRVLTDCLKPGGLMRIGLYSELARQHIVVMREEINQGGIGSSDLAMKSFRNGVINSDKDHHKKILNSSDFYSLSTLRDLLFHVQEHRFTIPQMRDCLSELGLEFCGFEMATILKNFKLNNTRADDPYNLDKWHAYEESNPYVFGGMYQFWCQKVG